MKWKLFILGSIFVSLTLSIVSWYYTLKIDNEGWIKWLMIIISLALSFVALITLIFPPSNLPNEESYSDFNEQVYTAY